jgi:hypothetical protein
MTSEYSVQDADIKDLLNLINLGFTRIRYYGFLSSASKKKSDFVFLRMESGLTGYGCGRGPYPTEWRTL